MSKQKIEQLFFNAVAQNYIKQVKYFVEKNIDINLVHPKDSKSALQIAAVEGSYKLLSSFISVHFRYSDSLNIELIGNYSVCMFLLKQPNIVISRPNEWVNQTAYHLLKKSPQTKSDAIIYIDLLRRLVTRGDVLIDN